MKKKPTVSITLGDLAGIGPEVTLKALANNSLVNKNNFLIIGSSVRLPKYIENIYFIQDVNDLDFSKSPINFWNLNNIKEEQFKLGEINKYCGKASIDFIKKAVNLALKNKIQAIVTAPISKEAIGLAGFKYFGHTDFLAALTNTSQYAMMFASKKLKVVLVTIHTSLQKAINDLSKDKIFIAIKLVYEGLQKYFKIKKPKLAVAGLNPHAGEGGILGEEENSKIIPAIDKARNMGIDIYGPYPPDIVFYKAHKGEFDVVVSMYHDQGLIPLKLLAFEEAVNITLGLPIIRTSPDHGTAFDIAGKNIANPNSMINAIMLATFMAKDKCFYT
ncbi:MAG: 4-hydroxythreonine-4-phosphate dehydrogenase PdxA [bacterium]|nr:4-hydroxythreonine-4-phosphate dehydrogenase PdxA [bacterium]